MDHHLDPNLDNLFEVYGESGEECATQVANGTLLTLLQMLVLVWMFFLVWRLSLPPRIQTFLHIAITTLTVAWFSPRKLESVMIFHTFSLISLFCAVQKLNGYRILGLNIMLLIALQNICSRANADDYFLTLRGVLMMHIMRLSTASFAIVESNVRSISFDQLSVYLEYIYFPPFIIFGPYMTFDQFLKMREKKWTRFEEQLGVFVQGSVLIFIGITLAIISSCYVDFFEPGSQFVEDALTAMSFRYSHYFICLSTQAFAMFLGSNIVVANPLNIEFSRSTLQTVSEWNRPFHTYLHENIFKRRFFQSTALNVLLTFAVSALLHARDYQMWLTLLALGFIAYAETVFRKRVADRFSMCVAAKPCAVRANCRVCKHKHTSLSKRVLIINLFFMILSMYHLVFTGMTFTDDYSAIGYPFSHTWTIWGTHYYSSFIISFAFLALSKII
ncbi:hypothetical protein B9Z55_024498 [Caenorhabditis nigoni]|nr:hypothetical protein B9Z55_024498 [Caenorhabditis nigoni]